MYGGKVYSISSSSVTLVSGALTVLAGSSDLKYIVSDSRVHRFNGNGYDFHLGINQNTDYSIYSYGSAYIVTGWTVLSPANNNTISQSLYVVNDKTGSAVTLSYYSITAYRNSLNYVPIRTSPLLTKMHF